MTDVNEKFEQWLKEEAKPESKKIRKQLYFNLTTKNIHESIWIESNKLPIIFKPLKSDDKGVYIEVEEN